jgi:hypothetical protein
MARCKLSRIRIVCGLVGLGAAAIFAASALSHRQSASVEQTQTWQAGDVSVEIVPVEGPRNVASVRLIVPTGSLHETDATCGNTHLVEHLVGRAIALNDQPLRQYGYRIDASTGPDRMVIGIDVGGGRAGVRAATQLLEQSLKLAASAKDLSTERAFIAVERQAPHPMDSADSPLAFLNHGRRLVVAERCEHAATSARIAFPRTAGKPRLLIFAHANEPLGSSDVSPMHMPAMSSANPGVPWRAEPTQHVQSEALQPSEVAITAVAPSNTPASPSLWLGQSILWSYVRQTMGARTSVSMFGDAAPIARLVGAGSPIALETEMRRRLNELATGSEDPTALGRAVQTAKHDICERRAGRRAAAIPSFARNMSADISSEFDDRLGWLCAAGASTASGVEQARAMARMHLAQGLFTIATHRQAPQQAKRQVPFTLQACAQPFSSSSRETIEAFRVILERQLGYRLRFKEGAALRLRVKVASADRGPCYSLAFEGLTVGSATLSSLIESWFAAGFSRGFAVQFCFDVRMGASPNSPGFFARYANLAPEKCEREVAKLGLAALMRTMKTTE